MGQDPAPVLPAAGLVANGHRARLDVLMTGKKFFGLHCAKPQQEIQLTMPSPTPAMTLPGGATARNLVSTNILWFRYLRASNLPEGWSWGFGAAGTLPEW